MPGKPSKKKRRSVAKKKSTKVSSEVRVTIKDADGAPIDLTKTEWVDHPDHYGGDTPYEVVKVLDAWSKMFRIPWSLLTTVKHIARYKGKGRPLQDLKKARWYLDRVIKEMEAAGSE